VQLLWAVPPVALIVGALIAAHQLRRIAAELDEVDVIVARTDATRGSLARIRTGLSQASCSLDSLDRR
jgi:cytochrome c-type biogenesis protein CcmH/NrfF